MTLGQLTIKVLIIVVMIAALTLGVTLTRAVVSERQDRYNATVSEIGCSWGYPQRVIGPHLRIPYYLYGANGQLGLVKELIILPDDLRAEVDVTNAQRYRGIYAAQVYEATVKLTGGFGFLNLTEILPEKAVIDSAGVEISIGLTDTRSLPAPLYMHLGDQQIELQPTTLKSLSYALPNRKDGDRTITPKTLSQRVPITRLRAASSVETLFAVTLPLRGSEFLDLIPIGKRSTVTMRSNWPHPSFFGSQLPSDHTITDDGFTATWSAGQFSRGYPQVFTMYPDVREPVSSSAFGVSFIEAVDVYHQLERATKYVLLILALVFGLFFALEAISGLQIHPMQYLFVGLAIVVFYLLLIGLSEIVSFSNGYTVSAGATVALVTAYMWFVLRSWSRVGLVAISLSGLFGFILVLLTQETYSLVIGSIGLFCMLALLMFSTRNVDWHAFGKKPAESPTES